MDISNPSIPAFVSFSNTMGGTDIFIAGNLAYIADPTTGFKIVDISDPFAPSMISCTPGMRGYGIFVEGSFAYTSTGYDALLKVVRISDPVTPVVESSHDLPSGVAYGIDVTATHVYVADWIGSSLEIFRKE